MTKPRFLAIVAVALFAACAPSEPPQSAEPLGGNPQPDPASQTAAAPAAPATPSSPLPAETASAPASPSAAASQAREAPPAASAAPSGRAPDVVYVPTPQSVVDKMLELAKMKKSDVVYDLGCGDGRIVVTAARKCRCRAVGFDIDPHRVAESQDNVRKNGLANLVRIEERDMFDVDLSEADVVMLYLLPILNVRLIPQFAKMKPGARIVSQDFDMPGVIPDRVVQIYLPERQIYKSFYLWTVPLKITDRPVPREWAEASGIAV